MLKGYLKDISWDFCSKVIIISFLFLQVVRWAILPQFLDMYYHLLTAQGFLKIGGYNGWDFLQYAPVGRMHIYPPLFHLILAFFLKLGIGPIILAKSFEAFTPVLFLASLYYFIRRNYSPRLAFFTLLTLSSSFSFYLSLINNIPATLAIIFGFFVWGLLFRKEVIRPAIILALCFYTHIGISWFLLLGILFYGVLVKEYRRIVWVVSLLSVFISIPIILRQFSAFNVISLHSIREAYFSELKIFDYLFAALGLLFVLKSKAEHKMFVSLLLASLIFLVYPYRFFSAQGYLPIFMLCAVSLENIFVLINRKPLRFLFFCCACFYCLLFSPTILLEPVNPSDDVSGVKYKLYTWDSSLVNMTLPEHNKRIASVSLWLPGQYLSVVEIIKKNSEESEIIYSNLRPIGVFLAALSNRATVEGLLPEIGPVRAFNPVESSKIIIITNDVPAIINSGIFTNYRLMKIGETKLFTIYKNLSCTRGVEFFKVGFVPFALIGVVILLFAIIFLQASKIDKFLKFVR
jgi:hypothetical protein